MSTSSAARLVRLLHAYGLLKPEQLRELDDRLLARFPRTALLAQALVGRGWVTEYQLYKLTRGQGKELVRGPFVVLDRLGRGAMGKVYKVRHGALGRLAALKVLRAAWLDDPQVAPRFRREIRAATRLRHPNLVQAYGTLRFGAAYGLVMEYVDGENLQMLVERLGPLPAERACAYVRQAAAGLQHAYERGVVHRDIKPSNLLLSSRGVIKVADFGLARMQEEDDILTGQDTALGTADYIAPEQALDSHTADVRADLYSLGCTLYFLLTGQPPFPGGSPCAKLVRHRREQPQPIQERRPEVPATVAAVLERLLAKRPEERYQTPDELIAALDAVGPDGGGQTVPDSIAGGTAPTLPDLSVPDFGPDDQLQVCRYLKQAKPAWYVAAGLLLGLLAALLCYGL